MTPPHPLESGWRTSAVVAAGIAAIGFLDYATGPDLGFSLFYLLPILVAVWFGPPGMGYGAAVLGAAVWWAVDRLVGTTYDVALVPLWNALIRLGMFVVIVWLATSLRQLNATLEQKVAEKTERVRRLASHAASAEARERDRIAQLLHDDLQQQLHASQFHVAKLRSGLRQRTTEELERAVDDLQAALLQATQTTRTLASELSPPALRDGDFRSAMHWLAEQFLRRHGLEVRVDAPSDVPPVNAQARDLLFTLTRECLFNVVRHAGVKEARVAIQCLGDRLEIAVEDGGQGFEPSTLAMLGSSGTGLGLRNAADRLELFAGTLRIDSGSARRGTRITMSLPTQRIGPGRTSEAAFALVDAPHERLARHGPQPERPSSDLAPMPVGQGCTDS